MLAYNHQGEGGVSNEQRLWTEVLSVAVREALTGEGLTGRPDERILGIDRTRAYLTRKNQDFDLVCTLAGFDPDATREAIAKQLVSAPDSEALVSKRLGTRRRHSKRSRHSKPQNESKTT